MNKKADRYFFIAFVYISKNGMWSHGNGYTTTSDGKMFCMTDVSVHFAQMLQIEKTNLVVTNYREIDSLEEYEQMLGQDK